MLPLFVIAVGVGWCCIALILTIIYKLFADQWIFWPSCIHKFIYFLWWKHRNWKSSNSKWKKKWNFEYLNFHILHLSLFSLNVTVKCLIFTLFNWQLFSLSSFFFIFHFAWYPVIELQGTFNAFQNWLSYLCR